MQARHLIAMAASVAIVASSITLFDHSMRLPKYSMADAPTVIDGRPVFNFAPVVVTPEGISEQVSAVPATENDALTIGSAGHAAESLANTAAGRTELAMPYYSFAKTLVNFSKD